MKFSFTEECAAHLNAQDGGSQGGAHARPVAGPGFSPAPTHVASAHVPATTVIPAGGMVDALSQPDAEFEVCGWFLRGKAEELESAQRILDRLQDSDFAHPQLRAILTAARYLVGRDQVCGATAVLDYAAMNALDVGGADHLGALISDPIVANADEARIDQDVDLIIDYACRRKIRALLNDRLSDLSTKPVQDIIVAMSDDATSLQNTASIGRKEARHISEVMNDVLEDIMEPSIDSAPVALGFPDLDAKMNGGIRDGELVLAAGRPGMGKTAFAMGVSRNISLDSSHNRHVLVFSLEMSDKSLASRILSSESAVPARVLRAGELAQHDEYMEAISAVLPRFAGLTGTEDDMNTSRLWIDDTPGLSMADIRSRSRQFTRKHGRGVILIDYIQIINQTMRLGGGDSENAAQAIGKVSQGLKSLARELNCPVIALSQLNRALEMRTCKIPIMSDLRESGSLEQDADIILFLYRDVVYNADTQDPDEALVILGKQREGEIGPVPLRYNAPLVRFENRPYSSMSAQANTDY